MSLVHKPKSIYAETEEHSNKRKLGLNKISLKPGVFGAYITQEWE